YQLQLGTADYFVPVPRKIGNCSCFSSTTCNSPSAISSFSDLEVLFTVPGFYIACQVIESLLMSTLECFYNQTCIQILQSYMVPSSRINTTALNSSSLSRYSVNSTIQDLLDQLMIEHWNSSLMYENYYTACHPVTCTYIYETRNDVIFI